MARLGHLLAWAATAVAVHRASGEVVVGTEDGCLAWFDGCL